MSIAAEQVREAFYSLPVEERTQLAQEFWEHSDNFELTDEQKEIIRAEMRAYEANPNDVVTWEELKNRLMSQTAP